MRSLSIDSDRRFENKKDELFVKNSAIEVHSLDQVWGDQTQIFHHRTDGRIAWVLVWLLLGGAFDTGLQKLVTAKIHL